VHFKLKPVASARLEFYGSGKLVQIVGIYRSLLMFEVGLRLGLHVRVHTTSN